MNQLRQVPPQIDPRLEMSLAPETDALGEAYCREFEPSARRAEGITLTPQQIVEWMMQEAACETGVSRVIDAGAGTGRFTLQAAKAFPEAEIIAVEQNPLLVELLRQNVRAAGLADRIRIVRGDYRELNLKPATGRCLTIGNPPYVRHHDIDPRWKQWYAATMAKMGIRASQLAGLHLHFFAKAFSDARPGDLIFFISAAEWMEVGYGKALRDLILERSELTEINLLNRHVQAFEDALTTSSITSIRVGQPTTGLNIREISGLAALGSRNGYARFSATACRMAARWTDLIYGHNEASLAYGPRLGDLFSVHRGQVTGMNAVWTHGSYSGDLPDRVLFPSVTRAKELLSLPVARLRDSSTLKRIVDLPADLSVLNANEKRQAVRFLAWAQSNGAHDSYVAQHRSPWYRVGLRPPAPIVVTYMARRPPRFVRNLCGARLINIAHGLYPREPFSESFLNRITDWLNENVTVQSGRTYAGGLTKFEPGEVMRLAIPPSDVLRAKRSAK